MNQLNSAILREIGTLSRCVHSICDIKFRELELQKGQYIYLTRICEKPGISFIELTMLLKVDKTSTTKAIQKLETEGYIERKKDIHDKRVIRLYATKKGFKSYDNIIDEENKNIQICLKDFNEYEKDIVTKLIIKMSRNVESEWKYSKSLLGGHEND